MESFLLEAQTITHFIDAETKRNVTENLVFTIGYTESLEQGFSRVLCKRFSKVFFDGRDVSVL